MRLRYPVRQYLGDYNGRMARGWESKSVEEQQSDAAQAQVPSGPRLNAEQKVSFQEKQGLLLSRKRVLQQLQDAQNPQYRSMLEGALAELDRRLASLS